MSTAFVHRNLPRLLLQARESVMAHFRPNLREHGLTDQQWRVLRVLGEHGVVETGRIGREAYILGPSLTGVLSRMERDGLVQRERDPEDQRRTVVQATARGRRMVTKLAESIEAHYATMESTLGKTQLAQLYQLLDQIIALPTEAEEAPDPKPPAARRSRT